VIWKLIVKMMDKMEPHGSKKQRIVGFAHVSKQQLAQVWKVLLLVFLAAFLLIFSSYLMSIFVKVPLDFMAGDPLDTAHLPWYTGFLSNLSVMLWCVAIGCSFTGALIVFNHQRKTWFLLVNGFLSTVLAFDDMFMLHEGLLPYRFHIPEFISIFVYGLIITIYLFYFFQDIFSDISFLILVVALLFFGASLVLEVILVNSSVKIFMKDSCKLIGIAYWLTYNFVTAVRLVNKQM
jgi:hypothetical protein